LQQEQQSPAHRFPTVSGALFFPEHEIPDSSREGDVPTSHWKRGVIDVLFERQEKGERKARQLPLQEMRGGRQKEEKYLQTEKDQG
jgi:hypothetical protein